MGIVVKFLVFKFQKNKFWAFSQMGLPKKFLKNARGIKFYRLLGTGGKTGFGLYPDFKTSESKNYLREKYTAYIICIINHIIPRDQRDSRSRSRPFSWSRSRSRKYTFSRSRSQSRIFVNKSLGLAC